jgi:predicted RNA-binding protein associated with RNAse of E/G family
LKILTFTGCWYDEKNTPSQLYLDVLKKGLKETTGWTDEEIDKYWEKFLK